MLAFFIIINEVPTTLVFFWYNVFISGMIPEPLHATVKHTIKGFDFFKKFKMYSCINMKRLLAINQIKSKREEE